MNTNLLTIQQRSAYILQAFDSNISKGGEGSKGGKIVGHTKTGKPIYESSHSIGADGSMVSNNKEVAENNAKFKHHRLLAAYHASKAHEAFQKKDEPGVKHHSAEGQKHAVEAKKLHNKKEHGGWMDSIPETKEAKEYGEKHYKKD